LRSGDEYLMVGINRGWKLHCWVNGLHVMVHKKARSSVNYLYDRLCTHTS